MQSLDEQIDCFTDLLM